ncbi:hypothetical protein [Pseudazoarcus pumilus]|uniref:Serine/threonine protein kinase n=1 Tax=Pseudazoarcus pumilus TaxID=2067960 RepID=A0A2I6S9H0_9RHOO|nr:hypothetical protein [Pseudazoarcus pumilus]AUN95910.1 hypothetical protein C0099_13790 [Pseudazoarcus pumilus]
MPDSACPVPASVVDALDRIGGRDATPERRHWEALAATNPVYRFGTGEAAWIVKRPKDADKDLRVDAVLAALAVPHCAIVPLGEGWIAMRDVGDASLERLDPAHYRIDLFDQLGTLAASALRLGMRDRKLANILVARDGSLMHIDYEGGFRAGLLTRMLRPHRYYRYLLTRLFFDVARHFGESDLDAAFARFKNGFGPEWARMARLRLPRELASRLHTRERLHLACERRSAGRICVHFDRIFAARRA